jgi:hypothetical protein
VRGARVGRLSATPPTSIDRLGQSVTDDVAQRLPRASGIAADFGDQRRWKLDGKSNLGRVDREGPCQLLSLLDIPIRLTRREGTCLRKSLNRLGERSTTLKQYAGEIEPLRPLCGSSARHMSYKYNCKRHRSRAVEVSLSIPHRSLESNLSFKLEVVIDCVRGVLSPLLANVLLDEVDRELERRGHSFVRYADDANVYVRSRRAGNRVMALLLKLYGRLRLKVNEAKSAVASVFQRKFLGYSFWVAAGGKIKRRVADKAMTAFKARVRKLTRRSGGGSLQQVVERLRSYVLGWKAYFGKAETPKVWRELDQWIRHRMRAIQLKQWRRGTTAYRELRARGARQDVALMVAGNMRRLWHNSGTPLNGVLDLSWADQLGIPRLC